MLNPNKIKQLLALLITVAGAWLTVVIVLKVHQPKGPAELLKELPKNIDISLQKIHYTETRDGVKRWELVADKVDYDTNRENTYFKKINMVIFGKGTNGKINLTADNARYFNKTGDVELTGNIAAANDAGMRFETGRLRYVPSRSMIQTDDHVRFVDGRLTVEGNGLELMLKAKSVRVLRNVTAKIGAKGQ